MLPSLFSTGSYGWKGAHRMAVELQGTEGKAKEKVLVMIKYVYETRVAPPCLTSGHAVSVPRSLAAKEPRTLRRL